MSGLLYRGMTESDIYAVLETRQPEPDVPYQAPAQDAA